MQKAICATCKDATEIYYSGVFRNQGREKQLGRLAIAPKMADIGGCHFLGVCKYSKISNNKSNGVLFDMVR